MVCRQDGRMDGCSASRLNYSGGIHFEFHFLTRSYYHTYRVVQIKSCAQTDGQEDYHTKPHDGVRVMRFSQSYAVIGFGFHSFSLNMD